MGGERPATAALLPLCLPQLTTVASWRDDAMGHKQTWSVIAPVRVQADCYDVIPRKEQSGVASCNAAVANAWA